MAHVSTEQMMQTATSLHQAGRFADAVEIYRGILSIQPNHAEALYRLAAIAAQSAQISSALDLMQRAVAVSPENPIYHRTLGDLWKQAGRLDSAIASYRRAVQIKPDDAETCNKLGMALDDAEELDQAIASYQRAIELVPAYAAARNNLASVWRTKGELDKAIAGYQQALNHDPQSAIIHNTLGRTWEMAGHADKALACYRRALEINPKYANSLYNIGLMRLAAGDFAGGWDALELRWQTTGFESRPAFAQPMWTGAERADITVLLTTEQGLGDTIHFIRYAPMVAQRCRRVLLDCPAKLVQLLKGIDGIAEIIPRGTALPPFDVHCPLMSLPRIFGTTLQAIPNRVPYVHADPIRSVLWSERFAGENRLKIGLVWAGNIKNKQGRHRSMPLSALAPLAGVPGVAFYSLQLGPPAMQAQTPPAGLDLVDLSADLHDLADTAAVIANLDLVISIDTVVAHLAGAMAKPVWTLLSLAADWRWLLDRSDSPWYPTMRLFRQTSPSDWSAVVRQVATALESPAQLKHPETRNPET